MASVSIKKAAAAALLFRYLHHKRPYARHLYLPYSASNDASAPGNEMLVREAAVEGGEEATAPAPCYARHHLQTDNAQPDAHFGLGCMMHHSPTTLHNSNACPPPSHTPSLPLLPLTSPSSSPCLSPSLLGYILNNLIGFACLCPACRSSMCRVRWASCCARCTCRCAMCMVRYSSCEGRAPARRMSTAWHSRYVCRINHGTPKQACSAT